MPNPRLEDSALKSEVREQVAGIIKTECSYEGEVDVNDRIVKLVPNSDDISMILIPEIERRCFCELKQPDLFKVFTVGELVDLILRSPRAEIKFPVLAFTPAIGPILLAANYDDFAYSRRSVIKSGRLAEYRVVDPVGRMCRIGRVRIDFCRNGLWHYFRDRLGGIKMDLTPVEKRYGVHELKDELRAVLGRDGTDASSRRRECVSVAESIEEIFACFEGAPCNFAE